MADEIGMKFGTRVDYGLEYHIGHLLSHGTAGEVTDNTLYLKCRCVYISKFKESLNVNVMGTYVTGTGFLKPKLHPERKTSVLIYLLSRF